MASRPSRAVRPDLSGRGWGKPPLRPVYRADGERRSPPASVNGAYFEPAFTPPAVVAVVPAFFAAGFAPLVLAGAAVTAGFTAPSDEM